MKFGRRFLSTPTGIAAALLIGCLVVVMLFGPALFGARASDGDASASRMGSSLEHPFGTDALGRDVFARVVVATRLTIVLAAIAVLISVVIGYSLGLVAAMAGPRLRELTRSALYLALAFPPIIVALFVSAVAGQTAGSAAIAVGIAFVPLYARTMLNLASAVRNTDYVRAARLLGISRWRLLVRHVAPNVAGPLWIQATLGLGTAMVGISALSFLGVGVSSPRYDWGSLLAAGLDRIFTTPSVVLGPALAITATGVLFAFIGEVAARAGDPTRWSQRGDTNAMTAPSELEPEADLLTKKPAAEPDDAIIAVRDLRITFAQASVTAVGGISFSIGRGTSVGIVGESGSGKSMTASALMSLVPPAARMHAAQLQVAGHDLTSASRSRTENCRLGTDIAMIFQDPMSSLTPNLRIGTQLCEAVRFHRKIGRGEARRLAIQRLKEVRMPSAETVVRLYPHQLSGGMRQRVMIAMALMTDPSLLIADEPTTALDVTVQAEILRLLNQLRQQRQLTTLLISHDIAVVRQFCDRVLVMHRGRIVEDLPISQLDHAQHPYTQRLLSAVPELPDVPRSTDFGNDLVRTP